MRGIFGDTFLHEGLIFRIYTNYHPKGSLIAYPIYKVNKNNTLTSVRSNKKIIKKYLKKLPYSNIIVPLIKKSEVRRYFSCLNIGNKLKGNLLKDFTYVKNRISKLGINKIGLSGYAHLKSLGFNKEKDENTDLDFVIVGKTNCMGLKSKRRLIYDKNFTSYEKLYKLIYMRRKKTTPYKINLLTAKKFEAKKPIGILRGRHVNITPTYKINSDLFSFSNNIKNLGIISTKIKIKRVAEAYSVPGFYEIKGKFKGIDISYLVTNFFFYSLNQKKKVTFDVRGNLIEHTIDNKKICILSLENWGDYRKYYMNIISDF